MSEKKKKLRILNSYIVSGISITLVLVLVGILMLLLFNVNQMIKNAKHNIQLTLILNSSADESEIMRFQKEIDLKPFCNFSEYISPSQALEEMKAYLGSDIIEFLDYNPFPSVINLYEEPQYTQYDSLQSISNYLLKFEIVDDIFYNKSLVYQVEENLNLISSILGIVAFLLSIIALALINNTIRLLVYSKRQEIKTMQLVGASGWFILKPFMLNSVLQGFVAGILADLVIILSILFIQSRSTIGFRIYSLEFTMIVVILLGIMLTSLATFFAIRRYLWAKDELIWT